MKLIVSIAIIINIVVSAHGNYNITKIGASDHYDERYVKKYLPSGASILPIEGTDFIHLKGLGDENKAIVAAYKDNKAENAVFLMVIRYCPDNSSVTRLKGDGEDLDFVKVLDINDDSKNEILLGTKIGKDICRLTVFSYNGTNFIREFSYSYNIFEVLENKKTTQYRNRPMAFWAKSQGNCYKVEVVRWNGTELLEAKELNKEYFKKVVDYYIELSNKESDNPYVWYYLADAQMKVGNKSGALASIAKGIALNKDYPTKQEFEQLKGSIT